MRVTGKRLLNNLVDGIGADLEAMSDHHLRLLRARLRRLTTTNCGWFEYQLRFPLIEIVNGLLRGRLYEKRRAKKAGKP